MKRSHLIAIILSAVIVVWMAIGMVFNNTEIKHSDVTSNPVHSSPELTIEVRDQQAISTVSYIVTLGNILPDREVIIRAETAGEINEVVIKEGNDIKENDILANIDIDDRNIRLDRTKAQTAVEKRKYNSLKNLGAKGYTAQTRIDEAFAAYTSAQADEKKIKLDIAHTKIKAPFDGVIDVQSIEKGDYVDIGDKLFTIVDNNPLVVSVFIPQQDINALKKGGKADVTLVTGEQKQGTIRFIAPRANQETRSFRVEIEIPNPDNLPSGTSATARIPKESVMAHFISPALLTLNNDGETGVKTINNEGVVSFHTIKIVSSEKGGIYVTGLPDKAQIIYNGQGFVRTGDTVAFVKTNASPPLTLAQQNEMEAAHAGY